MIRVRWKAISFVMRQWLLFPYRSVYILYRECISLQKGRLRNKMYLNTILDQWQELQTTGKKSLQVYMFAT